MFQKKTSEETPRPSRRFTDRVGKTDTVLGQGMTFEGELKGRGNLELQGNIEGNVVLEGLFVIRESGHFKGDVQATNVVVAGKVDGKILAGQKVELRSRCKVVGDIRSQSIAIADGCFFQGKVHMSGKPPNSHSSSGDQAVAFQEKRKVE